MIRPFPRGSSDGAGCPRRAPSVEGAALAADLRGKRLARAAARCLCGVAALSFLALSGPPGAAWAGEPKSAPRPGEASQAAGTPDTGEERRELWTGALYTSTYRIGMCVTPSGAARGVVLLRRGNGVVDVYHVEGTVRDGAITARHHSGHTFEGKYDAAGGVSGTITLKSGRKISLRAQRTCDARLTEDDCRPLPE